MKTNFIPLPLPGPGYKFYDAKSEHLRSFFTAMAEQFKAGLEIAKGVDAEEGVQDVRNAVERDVASFISEASNFFPQEFNVREFELMATGKSMTAF
jgi:hypothetical protein